MPGTQSTSGIFGPEIGRYPRLLVATEFPPNGPGGGAAVVRQMLKDWPAEQLYWWSCRPDGTELFGRKTAAHYVAALPQKLNPTRRWRAPRSWLIEKLWLPWAARHFKRVLDGLKPDVVWVIPHYWVIPPLAQALPGGKTGFHVSMHDYMDDRAFGWRYGRVRSRKIAALADRLYASATTRDAISKPMLDDLLVRTGAPGGINRAGLEQEDFDYLAAAPAPPKGAIRIAYAGTIVAEDTFALFASALARIRDRLSRPVTIEFFGDHSYCSRRWFVPSWMKERGNLPARELSLALKECDWGVAPMKLDDDDPRYNRFSLPTKFATYLAAGLPVITPGHSDSTVAKIASHYALGLCIPDGDVQAFEERLLDSLSEPAPKARFQKEILRCAVAEFDVRRMRAGLYANFRSCASRSVA